MFVSGVEGAVDKNAAVSLVWTGSGKKIGELQEKARWEEHDLRSFSKGRFFV